MTMSSTLSLSKLLQENDCLSLTPQNKIVCKYSSHEMPPRADIVQQYLQSKKFIKAKEWYSVDYSCYLPYIVPHKSDSRKLYCTLTKFVLNKIPEDLKKHTEGKKFKRLKAEAEKKKAAEEEAKRMGDDSDEEIWVPPDEILNDGDDEEDFVPHQDMDEDDAMMKDESNHDEDEEMIATKKNFKINHKVGKRSLDTAKNRPAGKSLKKLKTKT